MHFAVNIGNPRSMRNTIILALLTLPWLLAACSSEPSHHKLQKKPAAIEGTDTQKRIIYTEQQRLMMGYEAAQRWVDASDSDLEYTAENEARFLRHEVVGDKLDACLPPEFADDLAEDIYDRFNTPALYNAMAAEWSERYGDAQLAELHDAAMADQPPAPEYHVDAAPYIAARTLYSDNPATFVAFIRSWVKEHPVDCRLPRTDAAWQKALHYEPLYTRHAW